MQDEEIQVAASPGLCGCLQRTGWQSYQHCSAAVYVTVVYHTYLCLSHSAVDWQL